MKSAPLILLAVLLLATLLSACADPTLTGGTDLIAEGRLEEAEAAFRSAIQTDPLNADAHMKLGQVLGLQDDPRQADVYFRKAVELDPSIQTVVRNERSRLMARYQSEAETSLATAEYAEALAALDAADLMIQPNAQTLYLRGRLAEADGRTGEALTHYRAAHRLDKDDRLRGDALVTLLVAEARRNTQRGNYSQAMDMLREARAVRNSAELRYLEGSVFYAWAEHVTGEERRRHLNEAAVAFQDVLREHPGDQDAAYNLGAVLLAAERYAEAVILYRNLVAENPRDGEPYQALSLAHSHLGQAQLAQAEEAVGRALRADEPVDRPGTWAERSARRFPGSDLAVEFRDSASPEDVYTYERQGGGLVEVWFYWNRGRVVAFREGGRIGAPVELDRP